MRKYYEFRSYPKITTKAYRKEIKQNKTKLLKTVFKVPEWSSDENFIAEITLITLTY